MSLTKPQTLSPRKITANRQNAQKATGPRTAAGKRRTRFNALNHGLHAKSLEDTMLALGEDPEEYATLYQGLLRSWQPDNEQQARLVRELTNLYWRKDRLDRAQDALQVRQVESLEAERWHEIRARELASFTFARPSVGRAGLRRAAHTEEHFQRTLDLLQILVGWVERSDFSHDEQPAFRALYGKPPTDRGGQIITTYNLLKEVKKGRAARRDPEPAFKAGGPSPAETPEALRGVLLEDLKQEIQEVEDLSRVFRREMLEISRPMREARLAPREAEWALLIRLLNSLERQIDRLLKMLIKLKSLPWPAESPDGSEGSRQPAGGRRQKAGGGDPGPPVQNAEPPKLAIVGGHGEPPPETSEAVPHPYRELRPPLEGELRVVEGDAKMIKQTHNLDENKGAGVSDQGPGVSGITE